MKVWIDEACIGCKVCEELCPDVFMVDEKASVSEENIEGNEEAILEAVEECPVEAIIIEDDDYDDIDDDEDDEEGMEDDEI